MRLKLVSASAIIFAAFVSPAMASEILNVTLTGTVQSLTDTSGIFAGASPNDSFTLTYVVNTSKGFLSGAGNCCGSEVFYAGGSVEADSGAGPDITSPVSATLTIDGATVDFNGAYAGQFGMGQFGSVFGPEITSLAFAIASDGPAGSSFVDMNLQSNDQNTFDFTLDKPRDVAIDGVNNTGEADFDFFSGSTEASGDLTPTHFTVSVSAAPEPASWALMLIGVGVIGSALRMFRTRFSVALLD